MKFAAKCFGPLLVCRIFIFCCSARVHGAVSNKEELKLKWKQLNDAKIDKKLFNKMNNIHTHYYIGAVRGLLGAVGAEIYQNLPLEYKQELGVCLNAIKDEQDLMAGAKCISLAYDLEDKVNQGWVGGFLMEKEFRFISEKNSTAQHDQQNRRKQILHFSKVKRINHLPSIKFNRRVGVKIRKRNNASLNNLTNIHHRSLKSSRSSAEVWNERAINLQKFAARNFRNSRESTVQLSRKDIDLQFLHNPSVHWKRLRRSPHRLRINGAGLSNVLKLNATPNLLDINEMPGSPILKVSKLLTQFATGRSARFADGNGWRNTSAKLDRIKKKLSLFEDIKERLPMPKEETYTQRRLFDIVTGSGNYHSNIRKEQLEAHFLKHDQGPLGNVPLLKDAIKLVETLAANNISQSAKFLSPRIAPITREETKGLRHILSPSLFSFYRDESPNNIASLPEILDGAGLTDREQDTMMELAMEISGARAIVDKLFDNIDNPKGAIGLSADIISAMDLMSDVWTKFGSSFDERQNDQISTKGYTFMDRKQIEMFYGRDGLYKYTNTDINKLDCSDLTEEEKRKAMRTTIRKIAGEISLDATDKTETAFQFPSDFQQRGRVKRTLDSDIGKSLVLSPFAFAPTVLRNSILGATILSPNIFSPFIVNPQLLTIGVLSPLLGSPIILSPFLFAPFVLSPGAFVPFILDPYATSPFILSPFIASPFVLCPYALSPNILSPYVMCPVILCPAAASPDILSSTVLGGSVLSPTFLSPAVGSEYYLGVSALSPSFLSRKKRSVHLKRRQFQWMRKSKI